jgi:hypothetical protein
MFTSGDAWGFKRPMTTSGATLAMRRKDLEASRLLGLALEMLWRQIRAKCSGMEFAFCPTLLN